MILRSVMSPVSFQIDFLRMIEMVDSSSTILFIVTYNLSFVRK